jgi:hypothetical protein
VHVERRGVPDDSPATHRCMTCAQLLCSQCHDTHARARNTRQHTSIELSFTPALPMLKHVPSTCPRHLNEPLKVWGDTCSCLICRECIVVAHREHHVSMLETMWEQRAPELKRLIDKTVTVCHLCDKPLLL